MSGPTIGLGGREAESLLLTGFLYDDYTGVAGISGGAMIRAASTTTWATAEGTFGGTAGTYFLDVGWFNRAGTGASFMEVRVDGVVVDAWRGTGGDGSVETRSIAVTLDPGDVITLAGKKHGDEHARFDKITLVANANPDPDPDPEPEPLPSIGLGKTEAESLQLAGFVHDAYAGDPDISGGAMIRTNSTAWGTATGTFTGASGTYFLDVGWFNESAGASYLEVRIDGVVVDTWRGNGGSNSVATRRIAVTLETGDVITLAGKKQGDEQGRFDSIKIVVDPGPEPEPELPSIGVGLTEAESLQLQGFVHDDIAGASGGAMIRAASKTVWATAEGTFTGASGSYFLDVDWFNRAGTGASYMEVRIDGVLVDAWRGTGGAGSVETRRIAVTLETGDEITLRGKKHGDEHARFDSVTVVDDDIGPAPDPITGAFDFFAFAGQSNAEGHFLRRAGDTTQGPLGYQVFEDAIKFLTDAVETTAIEAAHGGSSSNNLTPSIYGFWWDLTNDQPGQLLLNAVATIEAALGSQRDLDGIVWAQGEHDADRVGKGNPPLQEGDVVARLKAATTEIFEYFRDQFGDVPIFIQELGDFAPDGAMGAMRQAQAELIAELDYVFLGASTEGYDHHDEIHFSVDGYNGIAGVLAQTAFEVIEADQFNFA